MLLDAKQLPLPPLVMALHVRASEGCGSKHAQPATSAWLDKCLGPPEMHAHRRTCFSPAPILQSSRGDLWQPTRSTKGG